MEALLLPKHNTPRCSCDRNMRNITDGKKQPKDTRAVFFVCEEDYNNGEDSEGCGEIFQTARPPCPRCSSPMVLKKARNGDNAGNWFWGCEVWPGCRGTINFHPCQECDSLGWLHMDNREGEIGERLIGHYGEHIEACAACQTAEFCGIDAIMKHDHDCGCGHGKPRGDCVTRWMDYRGANDEVAKALNAAGFNVKYVNEEDVEVLISPQVALLFNIALEKVYLNMKNNKTNKMVPGGEAIQHPVMYRTEITEIRKAPVTVTTGRVRCDEPMLANAPKPDYPKEMIELRQQSLNMLSSLNEMDFIRLSTPDQRKLESRRVALLEAIRQFDQWRDDGQPTEAHRHDWVQKLSHDRLPNLCAVRFEDIHMLDGEAVLKGICYVDGIMHHVEFIQVRDIDGVQTPVNDPCDRFYKGAGNFNDDPMETVTLTGFPGRYVMCIYPGST